MCKGSLVQPQPPQASLREYSWEEIRSHNSKADKWVVIDGQVYDVTTWGRRHPGGDKILQHHAGEDVTEAWVAFHNDKQKVMKYLRPLHKGAVKKDENFGSSIDQLPISQDFRKLRRTAEAMNLFETDRWFFVAIIGHILALDIAGCAIMWLYGTGWVPYFIGVSMLVISQVQAGWSQHDFGHLSVFKSSKLNHFVHYFLMNFFKGVSSTWWNYRHYLHHAKPNILKKDPDIKLEMFFLVGKVLPKEWGEKKRGSMPFQLQDKYFHLVMGPLLLPLYYNLEIPYFLAKRKRWLELLSTMTFFARWGLAFGPLLGVFGVFKLYLLVRFLEGHWFVWATQMSHIPMEVDYEKNADWVRMQLKATCNVDSSLFNDWFSGHLNFQIEHHLFPTMPRHNYRKIAPLCRSFCEKHGVSYTCKPMWQAFKDIVGSLKESGQIWHEAYNM